VTANVLGGLSDDVTVSVQRSHILLQAGYEDGRHIHSESWREEAFQAFALSMPSGLINNWLTHIRLIGKPLTHVLLLSPCGNICVAGAAFHWSVVPFLCLFGSVPLQVALAVILLHRMCPAVLEPDGVLSPMMGLNFSPSLVSIL
jgi:hypothetical protein